MSASWIPAQWPAPAPVIAGTTLRGGSLSDLALPGEPCWLKQVHGTAIVDAGVYETPPAADGCVGRNIGDVCVVRTADCLPLLMCSVNGHEIAAVHCGWRGLAGGVLENTIVRMSSQSADLMAWLGPAISQRSFEVGDEVRKAFVEHDGKAARCFEANDRGRWQGDLYALARLRLVAAGVTRIYGGDFCTYIDSERFFSYRRDPDCGRMVSFISIAGS